jgi:hypothetical protein
MKPAPLSLMLLAMPMLTVGQSPASPEILVLGTYHM